MVQIEIFHRLIDTARKSRPSACRAFEPEKSAALPEKAPDADCAQFRTRLSACLSAYCHGRRGPETACNVLTPSPPFILPDQWLGTLLTPRSSGTIAQRSQHFGGGFQVRAGAVAA